MHWEEAVGFQRHLTLWSPFWDLRRALRKATSLYRSPRKIRETGGQLSSFSWPSFWAAMQVRSGVCSVADCPPCPGVLLSTAPEALHLGKAWWVPRCAQQRKQEVVHQAKEMPPLSRSTHKRQGCLWLDLPSGKVQDGEHLPEWILWQGSQSTALCAERLRETGRGAVCPSVTCTGQTCVVTPGEPPRHMRLAGGPAQCSSSLHGPSQHCAQWVGRAGRETRGRRRAGVLE